MMAISRFLWFAHSHAELLTENKTAQRGADGEHFSQRGFAPKYHLPYCLTQQVSDALWLSAAQELLAAYSYSSIQSAIPGLGI